MMALSADAAGQPAVGLDNPDRRVLTVPVVSVDKLDSLVK
jgi:hypothetical protein